MSTEALDLAKELVTIVTSYHNAAIPIVSLVLSCVSVMLGIIAIIMAWLIYKSTLDLSLKAQETSLKTANYAENIQKDIREIIIRTISTMSGESIENSETKAEMLFPVAMGGKKTKATKHSIESITRGEDADTYLVKMTILRQTENPSITVKLDGDYSGIDCSINDRSGVQCKSSLVGSDKKDAQIFIAGEGIDTGEYMINLTAKKSTEQPQI